MTPQEIKNLQADLVRLNYMTPEQVATGPGIYGPKTTAAYAKYQADLKKSALANKDVNPLASKFPDANTAFNTIVKAPAGTLAAATTTSTPEGITYTQADYDKAYADAAAQLAPQYQAEQAKSLADTQAAMKEKQDAYNNYLATSGANFQADKTKLDQQAADGGVLFSSGRTQKEQNLKGSYERDQAAKLSSLTGDIGTSARNYEADYGSPAAQSLSQYYSAGGNTFDPSVARGSVGNSGLSSVYNTSGGQYGTGTKVRANAARAAVGAYGTLQANQKKLMPLQK